MEGTFATTEALDLTESSDAPAAAGSHLESWSFDIDGDTSHTMRYLAPDGPDNVEVYLQTADGWQKVDTTVDGSYLKFTAPAGTTGLAAVRLPESKVPLVAAEVKAISEALRRAAGDRTDPVIVINADAKATHQSVVDIMQAAQTAGYPHISFATQSPN